MSKVKYLKVLSRDFPHTVTVHKMAADKWGTLTESTSTDVAAYVEESTFTTTDVNGEVKVADLLFIFSGDLVIDFNDELEFNSFRFKAMAIDKIRGMRNEVVETEVLAGRQIYRAGMTR